MTLKRCGFNRNLKFVMCKKDLNFIFNNVINFHLQNINILYILYMLYDLSINILRLLIN